MSNMPFFKFDAAAWLTGKVQLLTPAEKGIFIDLVARIWYENGFLKHSEILHRQLRVDKATLCDALQAFSELGIMEDKDGFLSVKFILDQIAEKENYIKNQRACGARGGRPKKGTKANALCAKADETICFTPESTEKKETKEKGSEKENTEKKETPPVGGDSAGEPAREPRPRYPESVDEVLALAEDPRCAVRITRQQAETYFLARDTVNWVDACGRPIPPGKVFGDLRRWALRDAAGEVRGEEATPEDRDAARAERNRERAELEKAAEEWS